MKATSELKSLISQWEVSRRQHLSSYCQKGVLIPNWNSHSRRTHVQDHLISQLTFQTKDRNVHILALTQVDFEFEAGSHFLSNKMRMWPSSPPHNLLHLQQDKIWEEERKTLQPTDWGTHTENVHQDCSLLWWMFNSLKLENGIKQRERENKIQWNLSQFKWLYKRENKL